MFFAALLCSNHCTFCSFQWLKLIIWVLGISSLFKFENWLGTLGSVAFWKWGVFGKNQKNHEICIFQIWLFWPISISNLCHSQTIRDRCMKPSSNNPLTCQFLQRKSCGWKYLPNQEKNLWTLLAVRNLKFAAHDYPGF